MAKMCFSFRERSEIVKRPPRLTALMWPDARIATPKESMSVTPRRLTTIEWPPCSIAWRTAARSPGSPSFEVSAPRSSMTVTDSTTRVCIVARLLKP